LFSLLVDSSPIAIDVSNSAAAPKALTLVPNSLLCLSIHLVVQVKDLILVI
jgi:hypothetical protein